MEWEFYDTRADCDEVNLTAVRIRLNDLRLPAHPPPEDETYTVSVQWDSGDKAGSLAARRSHARDR